MAEYALSAPEGHDPDDDEETRAAATPVVDAAPRSLYVRRDVQNVGEIAAWARGQASQICATSYTSPSSTPARHSTGSRPTTPMIGVRTAGMSW
jgi:hypothetical protein